MIRVSAAGLRRELANMIEQITPAKQDTGALLVRLENGDDIATVLSLANGQQARSFLEHMSERRDERLALREEARVRGVDLVVIEIEEIDRELTEDT